MRAFFYFYLVNLYGDVPLALTIDAEANALLARASKANVYQQIITDLQDAAGKLRNNFPNNTLSGTTTERVRPTLWAAKAFFSSQFPDAEAAGPSSLAEQLALQVLQLQKADKSVKAKKA